MRIPIVRENVVTMTSDHIDWNVTTTEPRHEHLPHFLPDLNHFIQNVEMTMFRKTPGLALKRDLTEVTEVPRLSVQHYPHLHITEASGYFITSNKYTSEPLLVDVTSSCVGV